VVVVDGEGRLRTGAGRRRGGAAPRSGRPAADVDCGTPSPSLDANLEAETVQVSDRTWTRGRFNLADVTNLTAELENMSGPVNRGAVHRSFGGPIECLTAADRTLLRSSRPTPNHTAVKAAPSRNPFSRRFAT